VDLLRYLPASAIPPESVWQQCAAFDRDREAVAHAGAAAQ
jgi:hypothetical protein